MSRVGSSWEAAFGMGAAQRENWDLTLLFCQPAFWGIRGAGGEGPGHEHATPTSAQLPHVIAVFPVLLPSPSAAQGPFVALLRRGLCSTRWEHLKSQQKWGRGRTMAGFAGRAGSSAAALALCLLNKAFLQISGFHPPQHSAGNYKCLWLASIGNVPTAKPFPHLQLTGYGGTASSVRGMQSEAQHACSRG